MPKRPRDEHAPKRPQSSYFLYSNQRRKLLKTENPDKKITEISKLIAAEWGKMSETEKKPYEKEAQELKTKYDSEIEKYKQTKHYKDFQEQLESWKKDGNTSKRKKTKRLRDTNAPKKPQTAYFLFINDRRPKLKEANPDKRVTEISKLLGAEWKEMTPAKKKPWEDKAEVLKVQYKKDMDIYKKSSEFKKFQELLKASKTKKKKEESSESDSESEEKPKRNMKAKNSKTKKEESSEENEDDSNEDSD